MLINEFFSEKKEMLVKTNTKCVAYVFPPRVAENRLSEY